MKFSFVCRPSKARKNGESPLELQVTSEGKRAFIALDRKCKPSQFNVTTQKVRGKMEHNQYLDAIMQKCHMIETQLIKNGVEVSVTTFVEAFKNGTERKGMTLLKMFDKHNSEYQKKVDGGLADEKTLYKYENSKKRVEEYLVTLGQDDILLADITPMFCEGFATYCLSKLKTSTANKHLKHFKKMLAMGVEERHIDVNPFKVKIKEDKLEYNPLTLVELNKIIQKEMPNDRLDRVRDLFVFQCYTGLAYCDMVELKRENIMDGIIVINRKKTDVKSVIPILPMAKKILEKYDYQLPVLSNQRYNSYLAEIKDICNIDKKLHTHLGRHTMATILINNGVGLPVIAKILGHSSTKITESIYAQVLDKTVQDNASLIQKAFGI